MFYCVFKMALITPALVTPALINAPRKNNAELGPALKGPIRYLPPLDISKHLTLLLNCFMPSYSLPE